MFSFTSEVVGKNLLFKVSQFGCRVLYSQDGSLNELTETHAFLFENKQGTSEIVKFSAGSCSHKLLDILSIHLDNIKKWYKINTKKCENCLGL